MRFFRRENRSHIAFISRSAEPTELKHSHRVVPLVKSSLSEPFHFFDRLLLLLLRLLVYDRNRLRFGPNERNGILTVVKKFTASAECRERRPKTDRLETFSTLTAGALRSMRMPTKEDAARRDTDLVLSREQEDDETKMRRKKQNTYKSFSFFFLFEIKPINLWCLIVFIKHCLIVYAASDLVLKSLLVIAPFH